MSFDEWTVGVDLGPFGDLPCKLTLRKDLG